MLPSYRVHNFRAQRYFKDFSPAGAAREAGAELLELFH